MTFPGFLTCFLDSMTFPGFAGFPGRAEPWGRKCKFLLLNAILAIKGEINI